jgi:hypothetical protein
LIEYAPEKIVSDKKNRFKWKRIGLNGKK